MFTIMFISLGHKLPSISGSPLCHKSRATPITSFSLAVDRFHSLFTIRSRPLCYSCRHHHHYHDCHHRRSCLGSIKFGLRSDTELPRLSGLGVARWTRTVFVPSAMRRLWQMRMGRIRRSICLACMCFMLIAWVNMRISKASLM